jgi:hypothetical protein
VLFPFKSGLASKAGLRHLSRNNSGGSSSGFGPLEEKGLANLGPVTVVQQPLALKLSSVA